MDKSVAVRVPTLQDRDALARLAQEFAADNPSSSFSALHDLANAAVGVDRVLQASNLTAVVAEADGALVGCAIWSSIPSLVHGGRDLIFLDLIVVALRYRRRGIGTAIMKKVIQVAHDTKAYKIVLTTRADNKAAIAFHHTLSFKENGLALASYV